MITNKIREALREPSVKDQDADEASRIMRHRKILMKKRLLKSAFMTFYLEMIEASRANLISGGIELELGTGAGFLKELLPNLVTSDVFSVEGIDRIIDAQDVDYPDASISTIYAINVFHHLPDPVRFFEELDRVLMPGGGCILIEPHIGFASRVLHTRLHSDEYFDANSLSWKSETIRGPMTGANQALAHNILTRDRIMFEKKFGGKIEIVQQLYCLNFLRYLLSGGVNFRQLVPSTFDGLLQALEAFLGPVSKYVSLHQMTVLRKI